MNEPEFFIGWQAEMPPGLARHTRRAVVLIAAAVLLVAALFVVFQKPFASGVFEYQTLSTVEGTMLLQPAPMLVTATGKRDAAGQPEFKTYLLVAPGKFGADSLLAAFEQRTGQMLSGKKVRAQGYLIYNKDKFALELESAANIEVIKGESVVPKSQALGSTTLRGEITDPKCLLGVMKPGEGKPHRSCAVRCIAGGIPPVLRVLNERDEAEYYLLVGPDGQRINHEVLDFVADGVEAQGQVERHGDWLVFRCNPAHDLRRINKNLLSHYLPMCH